MRRQPPPIPEALKRRSGPTQRATPEAPGPASTPEPIRLYLAVPDNRFLTVLKQKARVFSSLRSDVPVTLTAFYAPDLPHLPDDLRLFATLTEFGEVVGVDLITLSPEQLP